MKFQSILYPFVFAIALASCSINIDQPAPASQATEGIPPAVVPTALPLVVSTQQGPSLPTTQIPVTWADLNLTGRLVYISATQRDNTGNPIFDIQELDLSTGILTTVYQAPKLSWIYYLTVSPDGRQLIMAYSDTPHPNVPVNQLLYSMPLDASSPPQLLITPPTPYDQYIQVEWSPDGSYLYFVHNNYQNTAPGQHYPVYELYRMTYPDGQPQKIADQAFWPRISYDGSRLVYISMDPTAGTNKIYLANPDGSNAQEVAFTGSWTPDIIDAPIFSPDGQMILFSSLSPPQAHEPKLWEKLLGIQVAQAHILPSEWWSVATGGGVVTQLTHLQTPGLFASFSPDRQRLASFSGLGLFVMNLDGTGLTTIVSDLGGIPGTVDWMP